MTKLNKKINPKKIPQHIAFIMDGNGRWAKRRGMVRNLGHRQGYKRMMMAIKHCANIGIKVVSIFAFSTENWNRPQEELDAIFALIRDNMHADSEEFVKNGIKVVTMGDLTRFPKDMQEKLADVVERTKHNTRCVFNLCANYGGRADIVRAVNKVIENRVEADREKNAKNKLGSGSGVIKIEPVTEQEFATYLYGSNLPAPDLIVRTSGEMRVSNFMLYQMAYSEFLFIKPFWPDMSERLIDKCVIAFQKRKRRYGAIKAENAK